MAKRLILYILISLLFSIVMSKAIGRITVHASTSGGFLTNPLVRQLTPQDLQRGTPIHPQKEKQEKPLASSKGHYPDINTYIKQKNGELNRLKNGWQPTFHIMDIRMVSGNHGVS